MKLKKMDILSSVIGLNYNIDDEELILERNIDERNNCI